jgi:aminopeptidase YwaD
VDQTEIRTQQGNNAPFNYRLAPVSTITSGSDHSVFNDGGIPAMQFNHWPDNFYHSSEDRDIYSDPTELKRVGVMAASASYCLSNAGPAEARSLAWEAAANGEKWIAEVTRQSVRLLGNDPAKLHEQHRAAQNKVTWAFNRAKGGVESVLTLAKDQDVAATVNTFVGTLEASRDANSRMLEAAYKERCASPGIRPIVVAMTDKEREYSLMVPRRLFKVYSEEAQRRASQGPGRGQAPSGRPPRDQGPRAGAAAGPRLPGLASSEVANFIDGARSILDIYNAVRAECGTSWLGAPT